MSSRYLPFNSHHSTDRPLYAVADSRAIPPHAQPSSRSLIVSERISSRADRASGFLKALCVWYRPEPVKVIGEDQCVVNETAVLAPTFPVDWSRKEPSPQRRKPKPLPPKFRGDVLQKAIYQPHGKWAWTAGLPFRDSEPSLLLSSGVMCSAFLKTGKIGDRPVRYVSKVWLTKEKWHGFFSELALYKVQLKSLQGRVVPAIINVYSYAGAVDVAMEPPHHSFWIEASPDMPHVLKKRCVEAFEKLHAAGVHHGDIELRHMLIGGDARVTIIDFQASRALVPNAAVQLAGATPDELRMEMRKVKFKLDYEGARAWEDEKLMRAARLARRNQAGRKLEPPIEEDKLDPPIDSLEWNLEWIGAPVEPARFVMPGQSAEDVQSAVEEFLLILEKLEEEETRRDGGAPKQRRPSPDFKPPPAVPKKLPGVQPPVKGFGATVVHPMTRGPRTLKRKGECDLPQEAKRIRIDASSASTSESSAPSLLPPVTGRDFAYEAATTSTLLSPPRPPIKVCDFAYEVTASAPPCASPRQPREPEPKRAPAPLDEPVSSSPGKRKRPADPSDESPETRGRPKMRTSLSCDVSSGATRGSVALKCAAAPPPKDASFAAKFTVPTPTPVLFRLIENLWRFVY
ncbi:hypothetical protein C8R44DRAFT_765572 [Mycena epipterygia]|nr:hypothetical protein C8R44DRAFT_765572 [Mycena epipterygia]